MIKQEHYRVLVRWLLLAGLMLLAACSDLSESQQQAGSCAETRSGSSALARSSLNPGHDWLCAIYPGTDGTEVPLDARIEIKFNREISTQEGLNTVVVTLDGAPVAGSLQGTPAANPRLLTFRSATPLEPDASYSVTLNNITDTHGVLAAPASFTWTFQTGAGSTPEPQARVARFVYALNSGDNTLSIFSQEAESPRLRQRGYHLITGDPETFIPLMSASPDGRYLFTTGRDDNVGVDRLWMFTVDPFTGRLTPTGVEQTAEFQTPLVNPPESEYGYTVVADQINARVIIRAFQVTGEGLVFVSDTSGVSLELFRPQGLIASPDGGLLIMLGRDLSSPSTEAYTYAVGSGGTLALLSVEPLVVGEDVVAAKMSPDGNYLYVIGDTAIASYAVNATGALEWINSVQHDQATAAAAAALTPVGDRLYIRHLTELVGYSVNGGSLTLLAMTPEPIAQPAPNAGQGTLHFDPTGQLLYASEWAEGPDEPEPVHRVAVFEVDGNGGLSRRSATLARAVPGPLAVVSGAEPVIDVLEAAYVLSNGSPLAALDSFAVTADGSHDPAVVYENSSALNYSAQTTAHMAIDPLGRMLYVGGYFWPEEPGQVVQFPLESDAGLGAELRERLPGEMASKVTSVAIDPAGRFAYAATDLEELHVFEVEEDGALRWMTSYAEAFPDIRALSIDRSGQYLYAQYPDGVAMAIAVYRIELDGTLALPFFYGSSFRRVTLDASGRYLIIHNTDATVAPGQVEVYPMDPATGFPRNELLGAVSNDAAIAAMAAHPKGRFIYLLEKATEPPGVTVLEFDEEAETLQLREDLRWEMPVEALPWSLHIDANGRHLYVGEETGLVHHLLIEPDGGLAVLETFPVQTRPQVVTSSSIR